MRNGIKTNFATGFMNFPIVSTGKQETHITQR